MAATTSALLSTTTIAPSEPPSPRFTLELEFVLSLSNPYYLSHLALTYPHLLNPPQDLNPTTKPPSTSTSTSTPTSAPEAEAAPEPESDASKFSSYLSYLYTYWRKPEYARFLTHPGATLRNLQLLQQEQFRRDIIRPDVIEKLLAAGSGGDHEQDGEVKGGEEAAAAAAAVGGSDDAELETAVKEEKAMDVGAG